MVPDSENFILETVFAAIRGAGWLGDRLVCAGDNLTGLGLSRLRLLAALIELEDKFDIEFPADAVDCFRMVGDIAAYIQSHAVMPCDDAAKRPTAASPPVARPSVSIRLHQLWARAFSRISGRAVPASA